MTRIGVRGAGRCAMMAAFAAVLLGGSAWATPVLIATGTLTGSSAGSYTDLSGLSGSLENGVPKTLLGGLGSGLAYAGGNTFIGVPDRGPNAVSYNAKIDDTTSYIDRFQTLTMTLTPSGGALPFTLTPTLNRTTLMWSGAPLVYGSGAGLGVGPGAPSENGAGRFYFTGRSDNFDVAQNSGFASDARLDPEGIRVSNDGKSVFVSDEYGPYVYQINRFTGKRIKSFTLPANLDVANLSPNGAIEISGNTSGRVANKGMEGLAITPDGKTLVGIMQAPLIQDAAIPASNKLLRLVTIDIASGTTHEYGYKLTTGSGVSEIVAINDHEFLLDERDGKGLGDGTAAAVKQLFKIDIAGATDITGLNGAAAAAAAVSKSLVLNMVAELNAHGIASTLIPAKIEGIAFGPDVDIGGILNHTLWVANDNDFLSTVGGLDNPNQYYVFGFTDADLGSSVFVQQAFVPEPASLALFAFGVVGLGFTRRRRGRTLVATDANQT